MLSLTSLASCQITSNIISKTEFYNIKINNITLNDIQSTTGIRQQVTNLIPAFIEEAIEETEENYYYYTYDGFNLGFAENEIVAFEMQSEIGGLWNLNWRSGIDENGKIVEVSVEDVQKAAAEAAPRMVHIMEKLIETLD